jgi:hypothetical protein
MVAGMEGLRTAPIQTSASGALNATTRELIKEVKKYGGGTEEDLTGFLVTVQGIAAACRIDSDLDRGTLLLACLSGNAYSYCMRYHGSVTTWTNIERLLRARFVLPNEDLFLRDKACRLSQTRSVAEYTDEFLALAYRLVDCHEKDQAYYYLAGLREDVRCAVWRQPINSLDDAIRAASTYDRGTISATPRSSAPTSQPTPMDIDAATTGQTQMAATAADGTRRGPLRCFYCNRPGHKIKDCRTRKAEQRRTTSAAVSNLNEDNQLCYSVPSADLLIIALQHKRGRVLTLIDSGASQNFILRSAVKRLGLQTTRCKPLEVRFAGNEIQRITEKATVQGSFAGNACSLDLYLRR